MIDLLGAPRAPPWNRSLPPPAGSTTPSAAHLRRAQEEAGPQSGHAHPRGRPQRDRAKGSTTVYRIVGDREHPMIIERPRRRGYRLHAPDSPEAGPCSPSGASPPPTSTAPLPSLSAPKALPSAPSSASTTTACSATAARLAPRPARCLRRALHPRSLAPGPGTARPRAQGQHGKVPRGRHPAGLIGPQLSAILRRRGPDPGGDLSSAFNPPWTLVSHRLLLPICLAQSRSIAYGD